MLRFTEQSAGLCNWTVSYMREQFYLHSYILVSVAEGYLCSQTDRWFNLT